MIGTKQAELQKDVFRNLCFWDEVSQKSKDFLPTPNVYHWHPVAFLENMREVNRDLPWILITKGEIGQKEIKGGEHNPLILEYHTTTTLKATTDENAVAKNHESKNAFFCKQNGLPDLRECFFERKIRIKKSDQCFLVQKQNVSGRGIWFHLPGQGFPGSQK